MDLGLAGRGRGDGQLRKRLRSQRKQCSITHINRVGREASKATVVEESLTCRDRSYHQACLLCGDLVELRRVHFSCPSAGILVMFLNVISNIN